MARSILSARLILLATMSLCSIAQAIADDANTGVGVIAEYRPAAGDFQLIRPPHGETKPVQVGAVLMAGDQLKLPSNGTLMIYLASGRKAKFTGPGTFAVPDSRPLGTLAAIFDSLTHLFDDKYQLSGTAASRGIEECGMRGFVPNSIELPIVVPGARIHAGQRNLIIGWRGGCPPFAAELHSVTERIGRLAPLENWRAEFQQLSLSEGTYTLLITDASGHRAQAAFEAVAEGPFVPADLAIDTSDLGVTAQAIWLAGLEGSRWRLESLERLRPLISKDDALAKNLDEALTQRPPLR